MKPSPFVSVLLDNGDLHIHEVTTSQAEKLRQLMTPAVCQDTP